MKTPSARPLSLNPEALGPLGNRPLAESPGRVDPADLFPGASKFLAARHQRKRRAQWDAVRPIVEKLLRPEEKLLYVAHAMQVPPVSHAMALRALALPFHQVVLALTDTRLIEVMLDLRGRRAGTRVRSFAWAGVRDLKRRFSRLTAIPASGKKQSWRVPLRGDRRLLDLLFVRLKPRLLTEGAAHAGMVPLWHCPQCVAVVPPTPDACASCRTRFTSRRLASLLSVAFPGAGLLYAGHPFLATMDFLGQAFLYALFVVLLLQAEPGRLSIAFGFGAFLFVLTKIHSIVMSRIMTARTRPESDAHRSGYGRFALIGGVMSAVLVGGSFPLAGKARATLERDLDGPAAEAGWRGSRNRSEWTAFEKDRTARSEWRHEDGLRVTLFAYPQDLLSSPGDLHREIRESFAQEGAALLADDDNVPAPFEGFRMITRVTSESGEAFTLINYFVVDTENRDVHQAVAAVREEDGPAAEARVRDFLSGARFVPATAPTGVAAAPPAADATAR